MAKYRQVHTKIWKDDWFCEVDPIHKLFFIYLFTNELASISGIYELPKRVMSFESGLSMSQIDEAFAELSAAGKAHYDDGVVWVANLRKYHETSSPKVQSCITKDIDSVKSCNLKNEYLKLYGIDTVSIPENGVSIPRYSSSSSSSSSSNGNGIEKNEYLPPKLQALMDAIVEATKERYASNPDKFYDAMTTLSGHDATPEEVAGFGSWWKTNGFYKGKPAIKSIVDEWLNYKNGETSPDASQSDLIEKEIVEAMNSGRWNNLSPITKNAVIYCNGQSAFKMADEYKYQQLLKKAKSYVQ